MPLSSSLPGINIDYLLKLLREATVDKDVILGSNLIVRNNLSTEDEDTYVTIISSSGKQTYLELNGSEGKIINRNGPFSIINDKNDPINFFINGSKAFEIKHDGDSYIANVNGYLQQSKVKNTLVKADENGKLIEAIPGEDYLTSFSEDDPIFKSSPAYSITNDNIDYWNNSLHQGDNISLLNNDAGYITSAQVEGLRYKYKQDSLSDNWVINHNLGAIPSVDLYLLNGDVFWAEIRHTIIQPNDICNTTTISLKIPASGYALFSA